MKDIKKINIIITGKVKNIENHYFSLISNIEQIADYFNDALCVLQYSNSDDNTYKLISNWKNKNETKLKKILVEDDNFDIIDYISKNKLKSTYTHLLDCELNEKFWNINFKGLASYLQSDFSNSEQTKNNTILILSEINSKIYKNLEFLTCCKPPGTPSYSKFISGMVGSIPNIKINPLSYVLENNIVNKDGLWIEFGVSTGSTIKKIASYTKQKVFGFDTFEGLPTNWIGRVDIHNNKIGSYSNNGKLPIVPENVELIKGFFSETLDVFFNKNKNKLITFMHIDCDLYQSTRDIFEKAYDKIDYNGCIIVFDELVNYPNYWLHELKAFYEFLVLNNVEHEWIGMNGTFTIEPPLKNENGKWLGKENEIVAVKIFKKTTTQWVEKICKNEKRMYSQTTEDGVLDFIFKNLKPKNEPPFFVEFGYQGEVYANTTYLRKNLHWNGLLMDGNNQNHSINLHKHFITSKNICNLFKLHNVPKEPEYVSIDIDSCELWVMESILQEYEPMVMSVEYNCFFPINRAITVADDPNFKWKNSDNIYGASLKALNMVANKYNYTLVYIAWYNDAFFIRNNLLKGQKVPKFESFERYCNIANFLKPATEGREKYLMDYEYYINNGQNIEEAQLKVFDLYEKLKANGHSNFLGCKQPYKETTGSWMKNE